MKQPVPSTISQVKTMSRGIRIVVDTQENLSSEQKSELFDLYEKLGYFFFYENPDKMQVEPDKLPPIQAPEEGEKSPSQRLRAVMFVFWTERGLKNVHPDFDIWYRMQIEKLIDQYKERLT